MKKKLLFALPVLGLILNGCSLFSSGIVKESTLIDTKAIVGKNIALLNFEKEGKSLPNNIEKSIPDKLAQLLFASTKVNITDRSLIYNAQASIKQTGGRGFSLETIKQLGKFLNADFIILGKVNNNSTNLDFIEDPKGTVCVSIRILSVESAKVIGMASFSADYKNDFQTKLDKIILNLAEEICR